MIYNFSCVLPKSQVGYAIKLMESLVYCLYELRLKYFAIYPNLAFKISEIFMWWVIEVFLDKLFQHMVYNCLATISK